MGMFSFLTGSKKKVNLTPAEDYPAQESLYFTNPDSSKGGYNLKEFAAKRIKGEGLGFGDDYLSKVSNPAIAQIDADFNQRTMPTISNEASKRGLARSSIVTDQIGKADQSRNRDIESMMANFYQLNEAQKKTDQQNAVTLASGLQDQQRSMLSDRAAASERQVGRNIDERDKRSAAEDAAGGRLFQAAGTILGGPLGGTVSSALGFGGGNLFSGFNQNTSTQDLLKLLYGSQSGGSSGVQTQILGGRGSTPPPGYNLGFNPFARVAQ